MASLSSRVGWPTLLLAAMLAVQIRATSSPDLQQPATEIPYDIQSRRISTTPSSNLTAVDNSSLRPAVRPVHSDIVTYFISKPAKSTVNWPVANTEAVPSAKQPPTPPPPTPPPPTPPPPPHPGSNAVLKHKPSSSGSTASFAAHPVAHPAVRGSHQVGHHNPCLHAHHRPPRCESNNSSVVYCSGGMFPRPRRNLKNLVLCFWPEDPFEPNKLTNYPMLWRLKMVDSNITEVNHFPYHDHLEELILSGLRLTWLGHDTFTGLRRLRLLDLSHNQLSSLDSSVVLRPPSLQHVRLSGNPWRCTMALSWLMDVRRILDDQDSMQCGAALYPRRPVMTVLTLLKRVVEECPSSDLCLCELTRLVRDARDVHGLGELVPIITVNCSHRGLAAMPGRLPANTTTLLLRGNQITSVRPLVDRYSGVLDVYLDNNQVESIADLEGSRWLTNFRVLSLRANKLQQLPTYALDNALERNNQVVRVYLGLNPWRCDCQFMPTFQELLAKYKSLIADWDDIRCQFVEGDDNSLKKIHSLSRSAVCTDEVEPRITVLDLVNAALGSSLILVLAKLAYDFWQYRRYGKLPWIATKIP